MGMDDLLQTGATGTTVQGVTAPPRYRRTKGPAWAERMARVTTYVDKALLRELQALRERGEVLNLTAFYDAAIRSELARMRAVPQAVTATPPAGEARREPPRIPVPRSARKA
jgi:hypothetical protein